MISTEPRIARGLIDPDFFSIEFLIQTRLPPLPANVIRISGMLSDFNTSQNALGQAIALDPVLSARLLRLANSAIYGLHGTVTSVPGAVSTIGFSSISEILMMSGVNDSFGSKILNSPTGKDLWHHSLATAMVSSAICNIAKMSGTEDAFSCGLLLDIGKLILLRADAPTYIQILREGAEDGDLQAVERRAFGFDHAELGAAAAENWKLPTTVCHMIRHHHHPENAIVGVAMAHIMNFADKFVMLKTLDVPIDILLCSRTAVNLKLEQEQLDEIWNSVSGKLDQLTQSFN